MENVLNGINENVKPIKKFLDNHDIVEVLNPNKASSEEMVLAYQEALNYNNRIMKHKSSVEFLMSVLLENKLNIDTGTPNGAKKVKYINQCLDYLDTLKAAVESVRLEYRNIITYYERYC